MGTAGRSQADRAMLAVWMSAVLSSARAALPKARASPASVGKKNWYAMAEKNPNTAELIKLRLKQNAIVEISSYFFATFCEAEPAGDAGDDARTLRHILRIAPNSLKQNTIAAT